MDVREDRVGAGGHGTQRCGDRLGSHVHLRRWPGLRPSGRWAAGAVPAEDPCAQSQAGQEVQGLLSRTAEE